MIEKIIFVRSSEINFIEITLRNIKYKEKFKSILFYKI